MKTKRQKRVERRLTRCAGPLTALQPKRLSVSGRKSGPLPSHISCTGSPVSRSFHTYSTPFHKQGHPYLGPFILTLPLFTNRVTRISVLSYLLYPFSHTGSPVSRSFHTYFTPFHTQGHPYLAPFILTLPLFTHRVTRISVLSYLLYPFSHTGSPVSRSFHTYSTPFHTQGHPYLGPFILTLPLFTHRVTRISLIPHLLYPFSHTDSHPYLAPSSLALPLFIHRVTRISLLPHLLYPFSHTEGHPYLAPSSLALPLFTP